MANVAKDGSDSVEALFNVDALVLDDDSPMEDILPGANKTPTTHIQRTDLVAVVDGGLDWDIGEMSCNSTSSQGQHVLI